MANPEYVEILRQGVDAWNKWREEHQDTEIDLSGTNFRGANLSFVNLSSANLSSANLFSANLSGADLRSANLKSTDLSGATLRSANLRSASLFSADLSRVDLSGATLNGADLSGADFRNADFRSANLSDATLDGADLSGAVTGWTTFGELDLRGVKGLKTVKHEGPSHLSINTIYKSEGDIPEMFVKGTGAPNSFIEYMHALAAKPIQYYTCFISYSSKDQNFAESLYTDLQARGVRCWYAPEDLKIGDKLWHRIDESIRLYDKLLVVLSENSVTSPWVENEVMAALEKEDKQSGKTVLFPIKLDETVMEADIPWAASMRRSRHIGDFRKWKSYDDYQRAFDRLLRDLKAGE